MTKGAEHEQLHGKGNWELSHDMARNTASKSSTKCSCRRPRVRTTFLSSFSPAQTRLFSARASVKTTSVAFLKTSMHRVIFVHSRPLWKQAKHDANHGGSQGMPPYPPSLIVSLLRDRHQTSVVGRTLSSTLHCRLVSVTRTSSAWFLKLSSTLRRTRCAFKAM